MIIFNMEGPKGSGKSTFIDCFLKNHSDVLYMKFDSDVIVNNEALEIARSCDVIFDRGLLSYQIYDWLWNNDLSLKKSDDFSSTSISFKRPLNQKHYDTLMELVSGKYIILYSSDPNLLVDRIKSRKATIGKGANELEWQTLRDSNEYYKAMGQFLKYKYPDKVELIDVAGIGSVTDMYNYIMGLIDNEKGND